MKYLLSFVLMSLVSMSVTHSQELLEFELFASGLIIPVDIANAGGDEIYIAGKPGIIQIVDENGNVVTEPFLDIRDRVESAGGEQGLLGLAFHPSFPDSPYVYVYYTGDNDGESVISRFSIDETDLTKALPSSEKIILAFDQPFNNHNGGDLTFGPDGYLYIPTGDGGSGGDPLRNGQDLMSLLGKMLRIDIDTDESYLIPPDNPFANDDFAEDEIWAYGLRNPWRMDFDPVTGDMYIADVGQNVYEEIDFQLASSTGGENYGWRCYEGDSTFNLLDCDAPDYVFPVHAYEHPENNNICGSVTGGVVYYGAANPTLEGRYLFSDFCTGMFATMYQDGMDNWIVDTLLDGDPVRISTFGRDASGEVYVADPSGFIYTLNSLLSGTRNFSGDINLIIENPIKNLLRLDPDIQFTQGTLIGVDGSQVKSIIKDNYEINISDLADGLYFLNVEINGRWYSDKVIISK